MAFKIKLNQWKENSEALFSNVLSIIIDSLRLLIYLPLVIAVLSLLIYFIEFNYFSSLQSEFTKLKDGELNGSQEKAVDLTKDLNQYIVSISTSLFGLVGYFLNNHKEQLNSTIKIAYLLSLFLLALGCVYAFIVYTEMTNGLSQGIYMLTSPDCKVFSYIQLEFILCIGASVTLGSIFVALQFKKNE